jgi:hypothetical protein
MGDDVGLPWDRLQPGKGQFERHQSRAVSPDALPAKAGPTIWSNLSL